MKSFFCIALMMLLSGSALAVGWSQPTHIRGYYIYDTFGTAYIKTDNNENPDQCGNYAYLAFDTAAPNFKAIWAQIISAYAMDQPVSLYYGGCNADGYVKIRAISIPSSW